MQQPGYCPIPGEDGEMKGLSHEPPTKKLSGGFAGGASAGGGLFWPSVPPSCCCCCGWPLGKTTSPLSARLRSTKGTMPASVSVPSDVSRRAFSSVATPSERLAFTSRRLKASATFSLRSSAKKRWLCALERK